MSVTPDLKRYIEEQIIPRYTSFDAAHRTAHVETVIEQSLRLAVHYEVRLDMVYAIAAYHDTGLCADRRTHHWVSGQIVRQDAALRQWFDASEVETMAQAVEDHRASSDHAPRSIYGKIVAEADRTIDTQDIITRTILYGRAHYPELSEAEQYARTREHLQEKYGDGGYLRLWIPYSPNARRLEELRRVIRDEYVLRLWYNCISASLKKEKL